MSTFYSCERSEKICDRFFTSCDKPTHFHSEATVCTLHNNNHWNCQKHILWKTIRYNNNTDNMNEHRHTPQSFKNGNCAKFRVRCEYSPFKLIQPESIWPEWVMFAILHSQQTKTKSHRLHMQATFNSFHYGDTLKFKEWLTDLPMTENTAVYLGTHEDTSLNNPRVW